MCNNGLMPVQKMTESGADKLVQEAKKKGIFYINIITPENKKGLLTFRMYRSRGFYRVEIDTRSCNWNISEAGKNEFEDLKRQHLGGFKDPNGENCIMRVYLKNEDEIMWKVKLWLMNMLTILNKRENIIKITDIG